MDDLEDLLVEFKVTSNEKVERKRILKHILNIVVKVISSILLVIGFVYLIFSLL
jgi:membrane-bound ClpP family serine protease